MAWRTGPGAYEPEPPRPRTTPELKKGAPGILGSCRQMHPETWAERRRACRVCRRDYNRLYHYSGIRDPYMPTGDVDPILQGLRAGRAFERARRAEWAKKTMLAAGAKPLVEYVNVRTPWPSQCLTCGSLISPRFCNVQQGHSPCKYCAYRTRRRRPARKF